MSRHSTRITVPQTIEDYMEKHDFIPADRDKIRHFLRDVNAITASITRTEIRWVDVNGIPGKTGRGTIGIQDNFS